MTAVARLTINNFPVLIGDLLMSNEELDKKVIHLPTVGPHTMVFPTGSGFTISGLRQKLTVIGDNLTVGWAGNRLAAKTIVKELIEINRSSPFTLETLFDYFDRLPKVGINDDVSFVGWTKEGARVRGFGIRSIEFSSRKFGKVGLLGSGNDDLRNYLEAYPDLLKPEVDHPWHSFSGALLLGGFLLRIEMENLSSLRQYYGGGYEIVGIHEDGFRKLDDVTFAFWEASLIGKKVTFTLQPRILKYWYKGDVLLIRSLRIDRPSNDSDFIPTSKVDVIPPIYRDIADGEINGVTPEMNSKILCNYFLVKLPNGISQVFCRVHYQLEKAEPLLNFTEREGHIEVGLNDSQFSEISEKIGTHIDSVAAGKITSFPFHIG